MKALPTMQNGHPPTKTIRRIVGTIISQNKKRSGGEKRAPFD
jgi:hypothetical protein